MDRMVIYWAAPCFTQAERIWNRLCAEELRGKGYVVILPQDEASRFITDENADFRALAKNCYSQVLESNVLVAILDGPDPDSGVSMESGFKIKDGGLVIGVRTDFRVSEDGQLNAMFRLFNKIIFFTSLNESYQELCQRLDQEIKQLGRALTK